MHLHCSLSSVLRYIMINMLSQVLSAKNHTKEAFITGKWIRAYPLNLFPKEFPFIHARGCELSVRGHFLTQDLRQHLWNSTGSAFTVPVSYSVHMNKILQGPDLHSQLNLQLWWDCSNRNHGIPKCPQGFEQAGNNCLHLSLYCRLWRRYLIIYGLVITCMFA